MFTVKIGPTITEVECEMLEAQAALTAVIDRKVDQVQADLNRLLDAVVGTSRIVFTIGPVSEQE